VPLQDAPQHDADVGGGAGLAVTAVSDIQ
jgi:hypothetical protein